MTHGHVHWSELMTDDVEAAKAFYGAATGWTFADMPMPEGTYTLCQVDGQPVAGIAPLAMTNDEDLPTHWMTYLAVADIDAVVAKAETGGGKIVTPPFDVPGVGRIAVMTDPSGARIGMMTPAETG